MNISSAQGVSDTSYLQKNKEVSIGQINNSSQQSVPSVSISTVKLSKESIGLSAKSIARNTPSAIETVAQAGAVAKNIRTNMANDPSKAINAYKNIFSETVKSLLG